MRGTNRTTEIEDSVAASANQKGRSLKTPRARSSLQDACVICDEAAKKGVLLCESCKSRLPRPKEICPEQIWSKTLGDSEPRAADLSTAVQGRILDPNECYALLIDVFGRPHLLSTIGGRQTSALSVGRSRRCRICIAESHISRLHAHIEYREHSGAWFVRHESRSSQTRVDGQLVESYPLPLDSGQQVTFGAVGFYFRDLATEELGWVTQAIDAIRQAAELLFSSYPTQESARAVLLAVTVESWGGTATARSRAGGTVEVRLTELEARFLQLLMKRRESQRDRLGSERGFVPSAEILASELPFDSSYPDKDNLKALVRRIRRRFSSHNANDIIESRQGFGYRIHPESST